MSRGLGQIQREIRRYFHRRPYAAITAEALCCHIHWIWLEKPTRSQMVALVRAVKLRGDSRPATVTVKNG